MHGCGVWKGSCQLTRFLTDHYKDRNCLTQNYKTAPDAKKVLNTSLTGPGATVYLCCVWPTRKHQIKFKCPSCLGLFWPMIHSQQFWPAGKVFTVLPLGLWPNNAILLSHERQWREGEWHFLSFYFPLSLPKDKRHWI